MHRSTDSFAQRSQFAGPEASPGFVFWRDFMRWQRELNALLKPHGLTQPQFAVLACCAWLTRESPTVTQMRLVEALGLDKMHVSQVASRLESSGLLRRVGRSDDQRVKELSVSERGHTLLDICFPIVETHDLGFFAGRRHPSTASAGT